MSVPPFPALPPGDTRLFLSPLRGDSLAQPDGATAEGYPHPSETLTPAITAPTTPREQPKTRPSLPAELGKVKKTQPGLGWV